LSKALEQDGIDVTVLSAGKYKTEQLPFGPLSAEAQAFLQGRVDDAYGQFVKDVARGRNVTPAAVRGGFGEGRALGAKDAKAAGLIDRIATMDETLSRLAGRGIGGRGGMRAEEAGAELAAVAIVPDEPAPASDLADNFARRLLL
jgi:ClpP class serine protease